MKSESEFEDTLRRAPSPEPTRELRERLKNDIHFSNRENGSLVELGHSLWRRWLPAIGYAVMVLGCVVVLAVQNHQQTGASQLLEKLSKEVAAKELQLTQQREQLLLSLVANSRIKNLQGNATEADQLAATLAELQALIAKLTGEAADLEAKLAAVLENNQFIAPYDFFNDPDGPMQQAQAEASSVKCVTNMKHIGLALRIWEVEHEDTNGNGGWFPPNLNAASREIPSVKVLCCPEDTANLLLAEQLKDLPDKGWGRWPENGGS